MRAVGYQLLTRFHQKIAKGEGYDHNYIEIGYNLPLG